MKPPAGTEEFAAAARQIRRRMAWIVLRAFLGVMFTALALVMIVTGLEISQNLDLPPLNQIPILSRLEGYYAGRGSWAGVQAILQSDNAAATLLDGNGLVVFDHGAGSTARTGLPYQPGPHDLVLKLEDEQGRIGSLVLDQTILPSRLKVIAEILLPVGLIAVFLALLAAAVGILISQRVVTPLADVIAAARAVTGGRLDSRVQVRGPQDLRALSDSFNQMAAALESSDQQRRALLADIAHELRTPISALRGRLEGMLDGIYPADAAHLSLALKSNYLLERLVEDLRLLTLAEAGQLQIEKKETDLASLAGQAIEIFSAEAGEKNIQLELAAAPGRHLVQIDPQRTLQIVANLIGNALRYIPEGGKVRLELKTSLGGTSLSVCDNGPGIPPEDLPLIFNRFWRKERSRARQTGGSGLGLAIAKQLCEAQGGTISAENQPAGGLKVRITFPARQEKAV